MYSTDIGHTVAGCAAQCHVSDCLLTLAMSTLYSLCQGNVIRKEGEHKLRTIIHFIHKGLHWTLTSPILNYLDDSLQVLSYQIKVPCAFRVLSKVSGLGKCFDVIAGVRGILQNILYPREKERAALNHLSKTQQVVN